MWGAFAKGNFDEEGETEAGQSALHRLVDAVSNHWGDGSTLDLFAPSLAARGDFQRQVRAVFERAAASPPLARALIQAVMNIDVSPVLPTIRVPTLVMHRTGDVVPVAAGRYLAQHIPGARFLELPGNDHIPWFDPDVVLDETDRFLTGTRHAPDVDRILTTVLFTDIVSSTAKAASVGDHEWRMVLEQHDLLVRKQLGDFNGREVKTTGDGFLATFDGPARAIRCACTIRDRVRDELGLGIRAGIHTGECEVIGDDVTGMAVHIGARVGALAGEGEVLVSSTVKDLVVGSGLEFSDRGERELKGVPGTWRVLAVQSGSGAALPIPVEEKGRAERAMLLTAKRAPSVARFLAQMSDRRIRKATRAASSAG